MFLKKGAERIAQSFPDLDRILGSLYIKIILSLILSAPFFFERFILLLASLLFKVEQGSIVAQGWLPGVLAFGFFLIVLFIVSAIRGPKRDRILLERLLSNVQKILSLEGFDFAYENHSMVYKARQDNQDRIESSFKIAKSPRPISIIRIPQWSDQPIDDLPKISSTEEDANVIGLPSVNKPDKKEWAIYLSPPLDKGGRESFGFWFIWPDFWTTLRKKKRDSIEYVSRVKTGKVKLELVFPVAMGIIDWESDFAVHSEVTLSKSVDRDEQKLVIEIVPPELNKAYRYWIVSQG